MKQRSKRRKAIVKRRIFLSIAAVVIIAAIVGIVFTTSAILKAFKSKGGNESSEITNVSDTNSGSMDNSLPKNPISATVINIGDVILHDRIFKDAPENNGVYDFSDFFKVADTRFKAADYSVANLEVTLAGPTEGKENHGYSGYPAFNSPDCLLDTLKTAGFKMLLTANNHSYDTRLAGLKRTVSKVKEYGFDFIGTKETEADHTYIVKDINGIKIGMTCFTYETKSAADGRKTLNGNVLAAEAQDLINSFDYNEIDKFYTTAGDLIKQMKSDGADAVVFYMHWGEEYQRSPNTWQKSIAQKLCNMGVDVIVGGHPHVLQP
ncbi:MAG: CapA family protein, partial [Clostridia bacterium]|nr:CapA family protein [Clostridia bacterium]